MSAEPKPTTTSGAWTTWVNQVVDGRFTLRRYLGGSDHGAVFLTEHKAKNLAEAAIKFVRADASQAKTLLVHWQAAMALSHPHLVQLFEVGRWQSGGNEFLFVVMEYGDQTLAEILRRRPLGAEETLELLPPVLNALTYLHRRQLVHGRLKPSNLLAVGDQLKLASDTIRREDQGVSTAGDVWQLGATLVEALTRRVLSAGDHSFDTVSLPAGLPASLVETVRRCLSPTPADRPPVIELRAEYKLPAAAEPTKPAVQKVSSNAPAQPATSPSREVVAPQQAPTPSRANVQPQPTSGASQTGSPPQPAPGTSRPSAPPQPISNASHASVPAQPTPIASRVSVATQPTSGASQTVGAPQSVPSASRTNIPPRPVPSAPLQPAPGISRVTAPQPAPVSSREEPPPSAPKRHLLLSGIAAALLLLLAIWGGSRFTNKSQLPVQTTVVQEPTPAAPSAPATVATPDPVLSQPTEQPTQPPTATSSSVLNEVLPTVPDKIQNKIQGRVYVTVRVLVDPNGNVIGVLMENAGPSKYFARLSDQAARQWQFTPADTEDSRVWLLRFQYTRDGVTVRTTAQ